MELKQDLIYYQAESKESHELEDSGFIQKLISQSNITAYIYPLLLQKDGKYFGTDKISAHCKQRKKCDVFNFF